MSTELVWLSIGASVAMGFAGACLFIYAVKKDYFKDLENAKYQVFWSDLDEAVAGSKQEKNERRSQHK